VGTILLDQNISFRSVSLLINTFKKVDKVQGAFGLEKDAGLLTSEIWRLNALAPTTIQIVTFDSSDFLDLKTINGAPPKTQKILFVFCLIWFYRFGKAFKLL